MIIVAMKVWCCWLFNATFLVLAAGQLEQEAKGFEGLASADNCTCLPYYQCANGSVIEDGASIIDVRIKVEGCENYLEVCCKTPAIQEDPKTDVLPVLEESEHDYVGSCGVLHPEGVAFRITEGTGGEAQFGEFPWMTAVLQKLKDRKMQVGNEAAEVEETYKPLLYLCGGSLIHPRVVLTGAHCVADHKNSTREWDSQTSNEIYHHQDRVVSEILIHPYFKKRNLFNNVALLFLSEPVKPAKHIGFVCLPPQDELPPPAARCLVSGWGKDAFGKEGKYSNILKRVDLPVVAQAKCQHSLRMTRLGYYFKLHRSFMCAGGEPGKDACKGDGGSPMVCPHTKNPERYMQSGIVAWGIGCQTQSPGVYTSVAVLRDWIDEKMHEHDLKISYYSLSE